MRYCSTDSAYLAAATAEISYVTYNYITLRHSSLPRTTCEFVLRIVLHQTNKNPNLETKYRYMQDASLELCCL